MCLCALKQLYRQAHATLFFTIPCEAKDCETYQAISVLSAVIAASDFPYRHPHSNCCIAQKMAVNALFHENNNFFYHGLETNNANENATTSPRCREYVFVHAIQSKLFYSNKSSTLDRIGTELTENDFGLLGEWQVSHRLCDDLSSLPDSIGIALVFGVSGCLAFVRRSAAQK